MKNSFNWKDPLDIEDQLSDEERMVKDSTREFAQAQLSTRILEANRSESFDREIMNEFGEMGMLGATLPVKYGPLVVTADDPVDISGQHT